MDLATIIGLVGGVVLMLWAILMGGSIMLFVDIPSIVIVFGGVTTALFTKYRMTEVFSVVGLVVKTIFNESPKVDIVIGQIVDMANIARKDGILALEKIKSEDSFLQGGINQCVDGADPEFLREVMGKDLECLAARHGRGISVLEFIGEMGPAFGMIGTLVGLVQMLANMADPAAIGPAMAVALITTFYGAVLANMMALPMAGKLALYSADEQLVKQIIIDGLVGIQKGVNPRMLQEALKSALPPSERDIT